MGIGNMFAWLQRSECRTQIVVKLMQPMTAKQLSSLTGIRIGVCSIHLRKLGSKGVTCCLNDNARRSRLYFLTERGIRHQRRLRKQIGLPTLAHDSCNVNWGTYGWLCYGHRTAIIKAMNEPMQPAMIRRR